MIRKNNLLIIIAIVLTLILSSVSISSKVINLDKYSPESLSPNIQILIFEVIVFPPGGYADYEIRQEVHNFEDYNVTVEFEGALIFPDGSSNNWSDIWELPANMTFGAFILCAYTNDLYGNYTRILTVKDLSGVILDSKNVSWVREPPLLANANGPYYGNVNEHIQFNGSATGGTQPYSWHWDFGDGATSNDQSPDHKYISAGNYSVTLTVTDNFGTISENTTFALIREVPIIEITNIKGGLGISAILKNTGQINVNDIEWKILIENGLVIYPREISDTIEVLEPDQGLEIKMRVVGIGFGLLTDLPTIRITASSPEIEEFETILIAKIIGPFVILN